MRERLMTLGAERLTDAELLSLVIGEGADKILLDFNTTGSGDGTDPLTALAAADVGRIRRAGGCGTLRAVTIVAAFEMARRAFARGGDGVEVICCKDDVIKTFGRLTELPHEEFWALYLTSTGRVIDRVRVSQGGVSGTVVDHRLIIKRALELLCSSIILVHNHPSGSPEPSPGDIAVTETIKAAAGLFDIAITDHVILSRSGTCSLAESGRL